jgi:tripartite motif-containing protein 71
MPTRKNFATLLRAALSIVLAAGFGITPANTQELPIVNATLGVELGTAPGDGLILPTDLAVGADGRVYVVDSGRHRIASYDATGNPLGHFAKEGKDDGQLNGPVGIFVGPKGSVYVADRNNNRVQVFSADGQFQRALPVAEGEAAATPVDIVVNGKSLYVTTADSHKVLTISTKGKFESAWGGGPSKEPGQFNYPGTITVDGAGNLVVADILNGRVQVFDPAGTPTAQYGKLGAKPGTFVRPKGVAVDGAGRIYVSDSYLGVVQVLGPDGAFVGVLGSGGEPLRFEAPTGLAFAGGRLYVTDMMAGKVLAYDVEGAL